MKRLLLAGLGPHEAAAMGIMMAARDARRSASIMISNSIRLSFAG